MDGVPAACEVVAKPAVAALGRHGWNAGEEPQWLRERSDLDPAVLCPALRIGIARDRVRLAITVHTQLPGSDATADQVVSHRYGAPLG